MENSGGNHLGGLGLGLSCGSGAWAGLEVWWGRILRSERGWMLGQLEEFALYCHPFCCHLCCLPLHLPSGSLLTRLLRPHWLHLESAQHTHTITLCASFPCACRHAAAVYPDPGSHRVQHLAAVAAGGLCALCVAAGADPHPRTGRQQQQWCWWKQREWQWRQRQWW